MKTLPVILLPTAAIHVLPGTAREVKDHREDQILVKSIKEGGIQQPLVVVEDGNTYALIDGTRRLDAAKLLAIPKVACVVDVLPEGQKLAAYVRDIRLILDEHRQDLLPSQKGELVAKLQQQKGYSRVQMAQLLGVVDDTIGNILDINSYEPEIRNAIDAGKLKAHHARVFRGMTPSGQRHVFRNHLPELGTTGATAMAFVRKKYPPKEFPAYYRDASKTAAALGRKQKKKVATKPYGHDEKRKLLASLELKASELADNKDEIKTLKAEIEAFTPIVAAVLRNKNLKTFVPEEMLDELARFAEVYV